MARNRAAHSGRIGQNTGNNATGGNASGGRNRGRGRHGRNSKKDNADTRPKIPMYRVFFYATRFMLSYAPVMFLSVFILGIPFGLAQGLSVFATQNLFDSVEGAITGYSALRTAYLALLALGVIIISREILNGLHSFLYSALFDKIGGGLQRAIHRKMSLIDPVAFENVSFHDDMEKADRGKWSVMGMTCTIWDTLTFYVPYFIFMGFYLHHVSPRFVFAIVLVFLPTLLGQIIHTKIISKFVDVTAPIRREHDFYYNAITNRHYYKETRILGTYGFFLKRYMKMLKDLSRAELSANRKTSFLDLGLSLLSTAGYVGILVMLVSALLSGEISVGAFAAVYGSIGMMFSMMEQVIKHRLGQAAEGMGFAHNFMRFIELPERDGSETTKIDSTQGIEMQNVSFTYPLAENKSIESVNLKIAQGETVAIVGENGAGKSTLVRLMIGLYKPDEGTILFGGADTSQTKLTTIFKNLTGVFQRFQRYHLTLKENIRMGDTSSPETIFESLTQSGLELTPATYPQGEDTMLSREFEGVDLSGGQWQRVAIARGLYRAHNIVVLDEPTAAIDPIEESRIYEKFIEISKNKTAIIVTHRLGSTKIADRVIVMEKGKIVDIGNHDELLSRGGTYAKMFHAQAEWYE
ncbi:MAG: ABC transporter ATP-binding protein/permease [Defluviitaleaceae bacterium]|nr:ABC transporter ATP-binding protein/permease [Defluviitaleaceae bacterium]